MPGTILPDDPSVSPLDSSANERNWDVLAHVLDDEGERMVLPQPRASWPGLLAITSEALSRMQERWSRADQDRPTRFHEIRFGGALVRKVEVTEDMDTGDLLFPPWEAPESTGDNADPPSGARTRVALDIFINGEMTLDHLGAQFASGARSVPIRAMMTPLIRTFVATEYMWEVSTEAFSDIRTAVNSLPFDTCIELSSGLPADQRILFSRLEAVEAKLVSLRLNPDSMNAEVRDSRADLGFDEEQVSWAFPEARNTAAITWNDGKGFLPLRIDFSPSLPWMDSELEAMGISGRPNTPTSSLLEELCASSPEQDV
ncbi:hypothetical protein EHS25_002166 [Saitozyma podzolica]|uniref:Uncharacterized protein n=1 Tax=Saitozyma podzolica TaxID=1890683 RepID=A0A427YEL3_9TREE|nr:hypothetical protein EHS25_002166 [Saitozyma podzolica]